MIRSIATLGVTWSVLLSISCTSSPRSFDDAGAPDGGEDDTIPGWRLACAVRAGSIEYLHEEQGLDCGSAVAADPDGSIYVAGQVAEAAIFGAGEPNETHFPTDMADVGFTDGFVARYAPDCTLDWVRRIGGTDEDHAWDIARLEDGSAAVVGIIRSEEVVLGEGEPNETTLGLPFGPTIGFLGKYRPDGGLLWAVQIPQTDGTDVYALTVHGLPDDRILVSGTLRGTAWPGEPFEVVSESSDSSSEWDGYLAWFDEGGAVEHAIRIGNDVPSLRHPIALLSDGSVVATMPYGYTELFGKGEPNETTLNCALQEDDTDCMSLARYDEGGSLVWVRDLGVVKSRSWKTAEAGDGSIAVTGVFYHGPTDPALSVPGFSLGDDARGIIVAKFDPDDGAPVWVRLGKTETDPPYPSSYSMIPLPDGSLVTMTEFDPSLEFEGDDEAQRTLTSKGGRDIGLARFSKDGEILWMYGLGNEDDEGATAGAQLDGTSMWLTGGYMSDPFVATSGHGDGVPLPVSGAQDIFLMRFDVTGPPTE